MTAGVLLPVKVTRSGQQTTMGFPKKSCIFVKRLCAGGRYGGDAGRNKITAGKDQSTISVYAPAPPRGVAEDRALGGLHLTSSIPDNIEVNVQGADKGHALEALAQRLGVPQQEVMALGDNGNDVTMLQYAGVSVAMGDGSPEAKAAAKYVTVPHTEDGLARALERFALI